MNKIKIILFLVITARILGIPSPEGYSNSVCSEDSVKLIKYKVMKVLYCESNRNPVWVHYTLKNTSENFNIDRPGRFKEDPKVVSPTHDDYTNSGYDRGHLAPNHSIMSRYGKTPQEETFYTTNISPMLPGFNRGKWRKIESRVDDFQKETGITVHVTTGSLFDTNREFIGDIEIPDAFYKVLTFKYGEELFSIGFMQINKEGYDLPYIESLRTVDFIEDLTGVNFNPGIPNEDKIESSEKVPEVFKKYFEDI